ncbi:MAG: HAD family hydrolase [Oscillospiraceae bacterium]
MEFDGIIFDMDGTLWNSAENVAHSWNLASGEERFTKSDIMGVMGQTMDAIALKFFPDRTEEERTSLITRCCGLENEYLREHGGEIYTNTEKTLRALSKQTRLFIVSNCQSGYIEAFLEFYRLGDLITDKLCWGDTGLQKSENIRLIMERNGISNALYVGDTQTDCDSAYAAGTKFAYAAYGFGTADRCDYCLRDIAELLE